LHLGSLICALASFLDARSQGGRWLLRMEDLDPPRESPGAARQILDSLAAHGLRWDGEVLWQSRRHAAYTEAFESLLTRGLAFRCNCTRAQIRAGGNVYRGYCRDRKLSRRAAAAVRVIVRGSTRIRIEDRIQPPLEQDLMEEVGDFIIHRRDDLHAYQLAVVLDDAFQGVTDVVRGSDLYDSTPRQVYLQRLLGLPTPRYAHIPVITNEEGQKLSKQSHAEPLDDKAVLANLRLALEFLHQDVPDCDSVDALLRKAISKWRADAIPRLSDIPERSLY
jgi:glutamyl-Q tRNA(Asp) synthetase